MAFLPNEILLQIYKHIPDFRDRSILLRVCRGWHTLFSEIYNSDLTVRIEGENLPSLAHALHQNSRFGPAICNLYVDSMWCDEEEECKSDDGFDDIIAKFTAHDDEHQE
ncbi:hypothetical protein NUU61_007290 [Penicillium alfredii]|uniref:F-box domain-containing protein n=1 Tax=Penicillium alfredii TaxID=1506179 RepID=A0A9W9F2J1_9EURO|nr:uncharacterized protein NUU61_007290 [Penicillium alfredii]KAJ5092420.1 hypothetical protein NUU61_007290 [Penicillium alfredii]